MKITFLWVCALTHIKVDDYSEKNFTSNAIQHNGKVGFVTGGNVIVVENYLVKPFMNLMPSICQSVCDDSLCMIGCEKDTIMLNVSFVFKGMAIELNERLYLDMTLMNKSS